MGWGMWVLMLVGMAGFWAVVLMGIRALFLAGGNTPAQGFRDAPENDATAGTARWLYCSKGVTSESYRVPEHGIDLTVDATNKRLRFVRTNSTQADSVNWQNDTSRVSPVGSATKPGVGDLVLWLDETAGAETVTGRVDVYYDTE